MPLRVQKRIGSPAVAILAACHRAKAAASVAWPQRSTSTLGVNQRRSNPSPFSTTNAVSDWFISRATSCIHSSVGHFRQGADDRRIAGEWPVGEGIDEIVL